MTGRQKTIQVIFSVIAMVITFVVTMYLQARFEVYGSQEDVCPHDGGWTKVEGDDFEEVDGATNYCWKGGSENSNCESYLYYSSDPNDYPPEGEHVCGLSHWSYYMSTSVSVSVTPTVFDATGTPTSSLTPTNRLTATLTPTNRPSGTPTVTVVPQTSTLTPTVSPSATLTVTQGPTATLTPTPGTSGAVPVFAPETGGRGY